MKVKKVAKQAKMKKAESIQPVSDEEARRLARRDIEQMERELKDPDAEISCTKEELDEVMSGIFGKTGKAKDSEPTDPYADDDEYEEDDDDGISGLVGGAIGAVVGGIAGLIGGIALGSIINGDDNDDDADEDDEDEDAGEEEEEEEEKECAE